MEFSISQADCLDWLKDQPDDSVDLIFGSPPYEDARTYGIDFNLKGQAWVDWLFARWVEMDRVCRGVVAMVVSGKADGPQSYSSTPALLEADLKRAGFNTRRKPVYAKNGLAGSGGKDWLRADTEDIVCTTPKGLLPWSDNTAMGGPPKYRRGGRFSNRTKSGSRGDAPYPALKRTNPGNIIRCTVGGGHLGSKLAHENEAPFPEDLPEFFIKSFCPPGGIVCDPFSGSGTTAKVAIENGRSFVGCDIRKSQVELTKRRIAEVQTKLIA